MTDPPAGAAPFEQSLACPGMPAWLPPVLRTLHDGQNPATAARWGSRVNDSLHALGRTRGEAHPPWEVVHDWQARTVVPLMLQACQPHTCEPAACEPAAALRQLHVRAAAGERIGQGQWQAVLEPALHELYRHAYGYASAYATAHASASAYASANDFSQSGAVQFANSYAELSTEANRQSYARSNAVANAAVLAVAYASGEDQAYAEAYPFALLHACAHAFANRQRPAGEQAGLAGAEPAGEQSTPEVERRAAYTRLADGLADSLDNLASLDIVRPESAR
ncbi:MAG TPA: hypothetical protein VGB75_07545 [Jatrophihabitans sp.]|uniref:SpcZ n=1 Tax=Jatrophihabitans sp. TaxID=1932789 RepID=UPI002F0328D5